MRFDELIRSGMTVREVRLKYPATGPVMEEMGFRSSCDDCSLDVVSRKYGLNSREVVDKLNAVAFAPQDRE
jgi:hypothetical protein